jgi:hypothetical protein
VLAKDITKVTELLELKKKLHRICKFKIKSLKLEHGVASNKLLGMQYNMDDRKHAMEEAQVDFTKAKKTLLKAQQQNGPTSNVVCDPKIQPMYPFLCSMNHFFAT